MTSAVWALLALTACSSRSGGQSPLPRDSAAGPGPSITDPAEVCSAEVAAGVNVFLEAPDDYYGQTAKLVAAIGTRRVGQAEPPVFVAVNVAYARSRNNVTNDAVIREVRKACDEAQNAVLTKEQVDALAAITPDPSALRRIAYFG